MDELKVRYNEETGEWEVYEDSGDRSVWETFDNQADADENARLENEDIRIDNLISNRFDSMVNGIIADLPSMSEDEVRERIRDFLRR